MYQRELFVELTQRQATFLGSGCYSKAFELSNGQVCKVGTNDATRNWLEFCLLMREQGKLLPLMPEVFQVTPCGDDGYIAIMAKYADFSVVPYDIRNKEGSVYGMGWKIQNSPGYLEVSELFLEYAKAINSAACMLQCFSDLHSGNVMWSEGRGWIITDPSSNAYMKHTTQPEFYLQ